MSWAYVNGANSGSGSGAPSITHGITITDGDLVVLIVHTNNEGDSIVDTTGSGATWSTAYADVDPGTNDTATYTIFYKTAASEPAIYTSSTNASSRWAINMHVATPTGTVAEDAKINGDYTPASTSAVVDGITTATSSIAFAFVMSDRSTTGTTTVDNSYLGVQQNDSQKTSSAYRLFATGGATGDVTFSNLGNSDTHPFAHVSFTDAGVTSQSIVPLVIQQYLSQQ